jgi:glucose/arabinose dehydrogenase
LATTAITRAVLKGNTLTQKKDIFEAQPWSRTRHHYGSRFAWGKDGYLYFSVGERGNEKENPQDLKRDLGKVHRIKDDGSIPSDNPFINTPGAMPSVYSYGHRNPQGMAIHPRTGDLWSNEHGPRGGDEINIVSKGKNYGWPIASYGINYNGTVITKTSLLTGIEPPLLYWIPSIAPSGMAFVTGKRYKEWKDAVLIGSLRFKYLNLCRLDGNKVIKEEILLKNIGRVRDVRMAPDGFIYVAVEKPGAVFRLLPVKE